MYKIYNTQATITSQLYAIFVSRHHQHSNFTCLLLAIVSSKSKRLSTDIQIQALPTCSLPQVTQLRTNIRSQITTHHSLPITAPSHLLQISRPLFSRLVYYDYIYVNKKLEDTIIIIITNQFACARLHGQTKHMHFCNWYGKRANKYTCSALEQR